MYFVHWSNYDGHFKEEFDSKEKLEERLPVILRQAEKDYGFTLHSVVQGEKVIYKVVSTIETIKIED